jgi:tetratricopeptide (TPR) repeat protein
LANILADEGKKEDVLALCKKTLAVENLNTQANTLIGEIYMSEKNFQQALPYLNKAVEIQPKLTQNRQNLAVCLLGLKQYDKARSILEDIVSKYAKFPLAHFHLGLLYEEQGRFEPAKKAYLEEFTNYEKCIPARFNYGKLLFKSGDRSGYIEQMKELVRIAPEQPKGYLFLARGLLYEDVDINYIQELVRKGLQLAKESELKALAYFLLADIYSRKNQPDKVKEALERGNYFKSK